MRTSSVGPPGRSWRWQPCRTVSRPSRSSLDWPTTWPAYVTAAGPFPDPGPSTMPALPMVPVGSPPRCFMPPWSPVVTSTATPGGRPGSTTSASGAGTPGWTCAETTGFPVPTGATDSPGSCWPGAGGLTLTTSTTCSHPTSAQPSVTSCCLLQTGSRSTGLGLTPLPSATAWQETFSPLRTSPTGFQAGPGRMSGRA